SLSNVSFVAFHYRSYGTFFLYSKRLHNLHGGFTHYRNYRAEKGREEEFQFYQKVERLAPQVIQKERKTYKTISPNIDFYSGFVYEMLGIPDELYTPLFAIARIVGWSAHRIEELINMNKIIRPAYESVLISKEYVELKDRK
ncbi:citrate/2-methylcitrate synthase, partial [Lactococcus sp.]|uniref:citrate/2-methylcitrate synthase n=1 Tax=Lactococcus sp. TaxID=44273 RepID=UPI0035B3A822